MKRTLYEYAHIIRELPIKDSYEREELLIDKLRITQEGNTEIFYAPHNEYINEEARLVIVGITPGFQQMNTSIVTARKQLEMTHDIPYIQYKCKKEARFSGSLRKNLIHMLNELELQKVLQLNNCEKLFEERDEWLHTFSLLPHPVFVNRSNYTGHQPKLIKSQFLMHYVYESLKEQLYKLKNKDTMLLIPLGKVVEEMLLTLTEKDFFRREQVLVGFPHPSGANGNRIKQFEQHKIQMMHVIRQQQW